MSKRAWVYISFMFLAGGLTFAYGLGGASPVPAQWVQFFLLLALTTLAQLFRAEAPNHQLYHPAYIFLYSAVLLLTPLQFNIIVVVAHLAEWLKDRLSNSTQLRDWYIQPFNIAMHIFLGSAARVLFVNLTPAPVDFISAMTILAGLAGALVYAVLNHLLVGFAIMLARRVPMKDTGILHIENLATDFVMLVMGYGNAVLFSLSTWLILPAIAPLYLIFRALSVPRLKQQANIDAKTGLWNAEYFVTALEMELVRSRRFTRPLTVVMADIDLLRNINNTYGHLAGDAVLIGVADILRNSFREYDIIARFGGEEFAVLIPETSPSLALERIESVRKVVEESEFLSPTRQRVRATMSFGLAGINGASLNVQQLLHCADVAVYAAKLQGRNQTCLYTDHLSQILAA